MSQAMTLVQKKEARMRKWIRMATKVQTVRFTTVRSFTPDKKVILGEFSMISTSHSKLTFHKVKNVFMVFFFGTKES